MSLLCAIFTTRTAMKLLVFTCLLAAACAYPSLVGTEKCTYGPSYWCDNYKQAVECEAVEHCRKFVWRSKQDTCAQCKAAVQMVNELVTKNSSKVLEIMKNICNLLGPLSSQCTVAVGSYGSEIVSFLKEFTADPNKLCQALEVCPQSRKDAVEMLLKLMLKETYAKVGALRSAKEDYCEDCKLVFAEVKAVLDDPSVKKEIISSLEALCASLSTLSAQCKGFVDLYLPLVLAEVSKIINPDKLCVELHLCTNATKRSIDIVAASHILPGEPRKLLIPVMMPGIVMMTPPKKKVKPFRSPKVSVTCAVCEFAMKELDSILGEKRSKEEIERALEKVCSYLPTTLKSECDSLVQTYGPTIVQLLLNLVQPSQVCTELKLCSRGVEINRFSLHKNAKPDSEACDLCKFAVQYLQSILETKSTEEEIKEALEAICKVLPSSLKTECTALVSQYGDFVIQIVLGQIKPDEVCKFLNLCSASAKTFVKVQAKDECAKGKDFRCASFKNAMKCKLLVGDTLGKHALAMRKFLCQFSQLQKNKGVKEDIPSILCKECVGAINYLGHMFPKNTTKEEILSGLKAVCSRFNPPPLMKLCDEIVKLFGDFLVKLFLGKLNPEHFCQEIGLC